MRLQDEVALVTGGGRGIGRAIALKFAREGASLVIAGRTSARLAEVEKEIRALGREVLALTCDVADDSSVRAMVREAEARFGRLDVLVNNAGHFGVMPRRRPGSLPGSPSWPCRPRAGIGGNRRGTSPFVGS